jgi:hypothetical protein
MNKVKQKMKLCTIIIGFSYCTMLFSGDPCHRFLSLRAPFQSGSPERESFVNKFKCERSFFQVVPFFGHTISPEHIARYFFPYNKYSLTVSEDIQREFQRDLAARHFNIVTNSSLVQGAEKFKSTLLIKASHEFYGVGLVCRQAFWDTWWFEAGIPILRVKNKINLGETIINNGDGALNGIGLDNSPFVGSMTEAFRQKNWKYGKIDSSKTMSKNGLGDLEIKIGYRTKSIENILLTGYLGLVFPTSNKPTGKFMFEPMLGNNGHYGLLMGSNLGVNFWNLREHSVIWNVSFNTRYLFSNHQIRSFDLKEKEFSAYIASYTNASQAETANNNADAYSGTSGINLYTQKVEVSPGFSFSAINSFVYNYKNFALEAGYNFYTRQNEKIFTDWGKNAMVKDRTGIGNTNLATTMDKDFVGAATTFICPTPPPPCPPSGGCGYSGLTSSQLSPPSAGTPYVASYTFYLTLGYTFDQCKYPIFIGLGGSYEIGASSDMGQFMSWGKMEVSF